MEGRVPGSRVAVVSLERQRVHPMWIAMRASGGRRMISLCHDTSLLYVLLILMMTCLTVEGDARA